MCIYNSKNVTLIQELIIIISGPLASLIISSLAFYITLTFDLYGSIKLLCFIFILSSLIDFIINLIPYSTSISSFDGKIIYNDGQQLKQYLTHRISPSKFVKAAELYDSGRYKEAVQTFQRILNRGNYQPIIVSLAISSYLKMKNYDKAQELSLQYFPNFPYESMDWINTGLIKHHFNNLDGAMEDYQKALDLEPLAIFALNNKGYIYILQEQFEKALIDLNRAIEIDSTFAIGYCNRALAKLKSGDAEEALDDLNTALKLNDGEANAYAYRNLGLYYLEKQDLLNALGHFQKAKDLKIDDADVDSYIEQTQLKLNPPVGVNSLQLISTNNL